MRKLRDPALVEWMGNGLLRARIFPIQPGEEKRIVLRFRVVVEREGDALRLDWVGTRRGTSPGEDRFTVSYPDDKTLGRAYSPTHALKYSREANRRVVKAEGGSRPLTLLVPVLSRSAAAVSLLAHAPAEEDGYALITLSPPSQLVRSTPRDVVFVLDVSGSMSGHKIKQARAAVRQLVQNLSPSDRLRLFDFSSDVRSFRDG